MSTQGGLSNIKLSSIEKRFGASVRSIRLQKAMSQEELAFRSGLNRNYISDTERGTRNISLKSLERIAIGLEVQIADLFPYVEYDYEAIIMSFLAEDANNK